MPSSTPPGYYRPKIPHGVIWTALLGLVAFTWQRGCEADHALLRTETAAGAASAEAQRAYDLAASCESRLDVAERKIENLQERIAPPRTMQQP